ncbi:MAG: aminopeptidase P family protein [Planctomycetes bacterium]|nr:aminopeptidase P family protein [Planctomycetota bacterium]
MSSPGSKRLGPEAVAAWQQRLERLRRAMADHDVDTLLVSHETDIRYLTGFVGHDSVLLVLGDGATVITDARYDEFLDPWREQGFIDVRMGVRHRLEESVRKVARIRMTGRIGFQAELLTVAGLSKLAAAVGKYCLVDTRGLVSTLRMRKDEQEIAAIERALGIQQPAMKAALDQLVLGMTERQFAAVLEFEMRSRGADGLSFDTIIAAGTNSSVIHYATGSAPIEPGVLLVDCGAIADGYCSDLTRTVGVGRMPPPIRKIYEVVLDAQRAAIEACAPGKTCAEIDAVARGVIEAAGHGEHFTHGLGHGLGLDIHEEPYFNELSTKVVLEPGMVMTVEPGIYVPGTGGVRVEDDVLITDDGCRVLSDYPKDLGSAVIEPATDEAEVSLARGPRP